MVSVLEKLTIRMSVVKLDDFKQSRSEVINEDVEFRVVN